METDTYRQDIITGVVPIPELEPVRVEIIDSQPRISELQSEADSVAALGEGLQLAAERLSRLRQVELELDETRLTCEELRTECETLRNTLAAAQSLLAQVRDLQLTLHNVLQMG